MTYDAKCYWLASQFLEDTTLNQQEAAPKLAEAIQSAIETWIEDEERK